MCAVQDSKYFISILARSLWVHHTDWVSTATDIALEEDETDKAEFS